MTRIKHKTFLRNENEIFHYCSTTNEMSLRDMEEHRITNTAITESTTRHSQLLMRIIAIPSMLVLRLIQFSSKHFILYRC